MSFVQFLAYILIWTLATAVVAINAFLSLSKREAGSGPRRQAALARDSLAR